MEKDKKEGSFLESDAAVIVHELQAPLSGVKWGLSMLQNGDAGKLNDSQIDLVKKCIMGNNRALRLVQSLLSVSRMQSGQNDLHQIEFPIFEIIHDVLSDLAPVASEKKIHINLGGTDGESPLVYVDSEKIRHAFENLLENAIKYSPIESQILVTVSTDDKNCTVSVEDNGNGIAEADASKIFTKFFRGHDHDIKGERGTGLGLYLTKNLIEAHGGRIWFEDKKRDLGLDTNGVRFSFSLPLKF